MTIWDVTLIAAFGIVAVLYSAVGQAGGTGYIAAMGLLGFAPDVIKPTALALNILVAAIGCFRFYRVGLLTWRACYPFAILGAPFSLLGGATNLPATFYQPVVGVLATRRASNDALSSGSRDSRSPRATRFAVHSFSNRRWSYRLYVRDYRRWDFSSATCPLARLGQHPPVWSGVGRVQPAQFGFRSRGSLVDNPRPAIPFAAMASNGGHRRVCGIVAWRVPLAAQGVAPHSRGVACGVRLADDRSITQIERLPADS